MVIDMSAESVPLLCPPTVQVTVLGPGEMSVSGMPVSTLLQALKSSTRARVVLTHQHLPGNPSTGDRELLLSQRETEVVKLVAAGLSNQDIADRLYLSTNTIKTYIRSSYRKIGVTSRSQAVLWAVGNGIQDDTVLDDEADQDET
jgi:DNA-binding NarL/FixJ family response regulator